MIGFQAIIWEAVTPPFQTTKTLAIELDELISGDDP